MTKLAPMNAIPSVTALRDVAVTLAAGENGGTSSPAGRWLELVVIAGAGAAAALVLRGGWTTRAPASRRALQLLIGTATLTLAGSAVVAPMGIDVFSQRYLTVLVPLLAGPVAAALVASRRRWLPAAAAVALAGLGIVEVARRYGGEWQPSLTPVRLVARSLHPRTVLTNTPLVLYYLGSLHPVMDRPYNLGPGRANAASVRA